MLKPEEIKQIKEQLISQIKNWNLPENQKQEVAKQIESMDEKQLEQFLIQNKLIKPTTEKIETDSKENPQQSCIFCEIANKKIPSYILDENKSSLAVLEINPLSKGHAIIIPKTHTTPEKISQQSFSLAKKIAKKIKTKLKPEEVTISTTTQFNHSTINIIPRYKDEKQERKKATEQELKDLQETLKTKPKIKKEKPKIQKKSEVKQLEKAPRRIP